MVAQGCPGVFGAVHTALLQNRHYVVDEQLQGVRDGSGLQSESVATALTDPVFDQLGQLLRSARELETAGQAGEHATEPR